MERHMRNLPPAGPGPASRREFLERSSLGFGGLALAHLLRADRASGADARADDSAVADPLAPRSVHFPATARSVIYLFMQGGASHVDTFDSKPELARLDGQPLPASFESNDLRLQFMKATDGKLMTSPFTFERYGESGLEISSLFEEVARHADDLAIIRSCHHESFIHGPALKMLHTGTVLLSHPSVGSWVVYGLGSDSDNLPAYVVMTNGAIRISSSAYSSGFLPAVYQGTLLRTEGTPIQNLSLPRGIDGHEQRVLLDQIQRWNRRHLESRPDDSRLEARIANYELAFRMQSAAPELIDIAREPKHVRDLYGVDREPSAKFGRMCLLARRMVERGVRFIQLYSTDWDGHAECEANHRSNAS